MKTTFKKIYSRPTFLNEIDIPENNSKNLLYLPIKDIHCCDLILPDDYKILGSYIHDIIKDHYWDKYVYLSYETSILTPFKTQKRPGWHIDGYLTDDINYIWSNTLPTEYYEGYVTLSEDHNLSLKEMEIKIKSNIKRFPNKTVVRLTNQDIHRASVPLIPRKRTFFKLSISDKLYNLKGNSINPELNIINRYYDRDIVRNHPIFNESDSIPDGEILCLKN